MKTFDLRRAVPKTLILLGDRGEPTTVSAVLKTLGVACAPTLPPSASTSKRLAPDPRGEELVSLGRFQLLGELGRGGMGRVLEARDPELRRSVAVKVIIEPSRVTEAQLRRFVAEAQITSQLEHPNIVPVYDMGLSDDGQLYFVMRTAENGAN